MPRRRARLTYENRAVLLLLGAGAPAVLTAVILLWRTPLGLLDRISILLPVMGLWIGFALVLRAHAVRPIQTLSNMLAALREQDFSIRARGADTKSAMGLALHEVNALSDVLRRERHESLEASALLRRVMDSIDVALFTFDDERKLRMLNREAEAILGRPAERVLGSEAAWLGLATALEGDTPRLLELTLPGRAGRWEVRRAEFRQEGRLHQLVVLSDLTRALRTEEREAWLRLIRVLSHEINNSLAPIQSIAASLHARAGEAAGAGPDFAEGLEVIESRARALARFMRAYVQFARLPAPALAPVEVGPRARHAAALETRLKVVVADGPRALIQGDADQLDQLLINLVRNAADAALETGGAVIVSWRVANGWLELRVEDEGPGIADTGNLFVPFFTTKPDGTGIGLVLCRQIAESHGGTLTLANRTDGRGAVATVRLAARPAPAA